jgi:hypothetical protein
MAWWQSVVEMSYGGESWLGGATDVRDLGSHDVILTAFGGGQFSGRVFSYEVVMKKKGASGPQGTVTKEEREALLGMQVKTVKLGFARAGTFKKLQRFCEKFRALTGFGVPIWYHATLLVGDGEKSAIVEFGDYDGKDKFGFFRNHPVSLR